VTCLKGKKTAHLFCSSLNLLINFIALSDVLQDNLITQQQQQQQQLARTSKAAFAKPIVAKKPRRSL
jgi:hypothetical protein